MHETLWNRTTVGKAAPAGHPSVKSGQKSVGRGTGLECICKLGVSLVANISREGFRRATPQAHSRAPTKAVEVSEKTIGKGAPEGPPSRRLSDRPVDLEPDSQSDRPGVRGPISSLPRLEAPGKPGMELSETRASSFAKEGRRNCPLEAVPLAPYKKKPKDLGPIWSSSMNPGFCLSPMSLVLGHPKGRPLSFIISISKTEFLPSVVCRCLPEEGVWLFIFGFAHAISLVWMFVLSSKACSSTSGGPLVLLWDRGTIHRRKEVQQFLLSHPRLHVHEFPAYAPELNPAEYVWNQTDRALSNSAPEDLAELKGMLRNSVRRIRSSRKLLWSCIYASDLPWVR